MRKFSPSVKLLLSLDELNYCYLVKIATPDVTFYYTNNPSNIVYEGTTFLSNSDLHLVEIPKLSDELDRSSYKLTFIDPLYSKRALFENGLVGTAITISIVFANTTDTVLNGIAPGNFLLSTEDVIIAYKGRVDNIGYAVDVNEGTVLAVIECASPMAALDCNNAFYTSNESMQRINPNDTSFNQITVSTELISQVWGKA